jgi:hypothetical protein
MESPTACKGGPVCSVTARVGAGQPKDQEATFRIIKLYHQDNRQSVRQVMPRPHTCAEMFPQPRAKSVQRMQRLRHLPPHRVKSDGKKCGGSRYASITAAGLRARYAGAPASALTPASRASAKSVADRRYASIIAQGACAAPDTSYPLSLCASARHAGTPSICPHSREKSQCKECGGSQICEHSRRRSESVQGMRGLRCLPQQSFEVQVQGVQVR